MSRFLNGVSSRMVSWYNLAYQSKEFTMSVAESAKAHYESNLRAQMEEEHLGKFIAVEPESG